LLEYRSLIAAAIIKRQDVGILLEAQLAHTSHPVVECFLFLPYVGVWSIDLHDVQDCRWSLLQQLNWLHSPILLNGIHSHRCVR
jgi:hypothetical protein